MHKKALTLLLAGIMLAQSISALAYNEGYVLNYLNNEVEKYSTADDVTANSTEILNKLTSDEYQCTEEEAKQFLEELKTKVTEKAEADSKTDENKTDSNKNDDSNKAQEEKKVTELDFKKQLLNQLGCIKNAVEFDYSKKISRGEFAQYIANLINYGEDYSDERGVFEFNDVESDSEYYSAVSSLLNRGAIIGVGEGYYEPDTEITFNQACAIAVRLMGYELYKLPDNENDIFYWTEANKEKLLDGIKVKNTDNMTGEQAIQFLFNMLNAHVVSQDFDESSFTLTNENTFLHDYMNLGYVEGVVTANTKTDLYSGAGSANEGYIKVDGQLYKLDSVKDIDDYLGKKVRIYYDLSDESEGKAIYVLSRYNSYTHVTADMIDRFDVTEGKLYYYEDGTNKEKSVTLNMNTSIIFNGKAVDYEHDKKLLFEPDAGEITFIDNNRDSKPEVAIISSYVYYKVSPINSETPVMYDELGVQPDMKLDGDNILIYENGTQISVSQLSEQALAMVMPSRVIFEKNGNTSFMKADLENSELIRIELCKSLADGEVKKFNKNSENVTIESTEYNLSKIFTKELSIYPQNPNLKAPAIGAMVTAKLDKYGNAAFFEINSYSQGLKYGFVKRIVHDTESDEEKYIARIFNEDGEHISVELPEKVKVYKKWDENAKLTDTTYYGKRITAENLANINGGTFYRQMVKYNLNKDGKLNEIYLADTTNTTSVLGKKDLSFYVADNVFMKGYTSVGGVTYQGYQIGSWFEYKNNFTVYFKIPKSASGEDYEYSTSKTQLFIDYKDIDYYDLTEAGEVGCAVKYVEGASKTGTSSGKATPLIITQDIEPYWDEKTEEVRYRIEAYTLQQITVGMRAGSMTTLTFADPEMTSFAIAENNGVGRGENSNIPVSQLKKGDILYAYIDESTNTINGFMLIEKDLGVRDADGNLESAAFHITLNEGGSSMNRSEAISYVGGFYVKGKVVKAVNNYKFYVDDGTMYRRHDIRAYQWNSDLVAIYDVEKKTIEEATFSDIRVGDYVAILLDTLAVIVRNY